MIQIIKYTNLPRKTKKRLANLFITDEEAQGLSPREARKVMKNIYGIEVVKNNGLTKLPFSHFKNMCILQWQQPLFIRDLLRSKKIFSMC
jgi:hypothetical protein